MAVLKVKVKCTILPKNLFQIQIILVNIPTRAYNLKIKRIPSRVNIFTRKNKRCYIYLPIRYNRPSLCRGHQTVTIMKYFFNSPGKMKAKYIVLYLNAFAKLQNTRGAFRHPLLMGNRPTCNDMPWPYQSTEWFAISPFQVVCRA